MENREAHLGKRETQLKEWGAKLDQLSAKANAAGAGAKLDYQKGIEGLKVSYKDTEAKFAAFKAASSENLATAKAGLESAWNELEMAFKKLKY